IEWVQWPASGDWSRELGGVSGVVHLAARVHQIRESGPGVYKSYRQVNVDRTSGLAIAARDAGVACFVFLSSIKVNGEHSPPDGAGGWAALSGADEPRPEDDYGKTKWYAEQLLGETFSHDHTRLAVLRPPLVFGPGVRANFLSLMRLVIKGVPLPLASVHNARSLIYVENLADAVVSTLANDAVRGTYTLADVTLSTPELIACIADGAQRPARLLPCPPALLRTAARVLGREEQVRRLIGSLRVDASQFMAASGWSPQVPREQAFERTCEWAINAS
ncbi:MAG: NAD-dependent epimerase/dehydratase family protein, partial [Gammaproteobacteria bacterium]|nr:NAD-dependent epimerase/dehydratase family protein [Gammaproteobacteria bacterium]